jgi:hypothetical protein
VTRFFAAVIIIGAAVWFIANHQGDTYTITIPVFDGDR